MIFMSLMILGSCGPLVITSLKNSPTLLNNDGEIRVLGLEDEIPFDAELLGIVKVGDSGVTFSKNCDYHDVIEKAKFEARLAGGNAIKIIKHRSPDRNSTCHRIEARILKLNKIDINSSAFRDTEMFNSDYAILNIYSDSCSDSCNYDLYLGDSVICKVIDNLKITICIKQIGLNTIRAKLDSTSQIPIDIKAGQTYYLRCSTSMAGSVRQPVLEIVDTKTGSQVFDLFSTVN